MADNAWFSGRQFSDNSGDPLAGGKLYIYDAGTTSERTVYQDAAEAVAWAQPITLDANGRLTAGVYVVSGAWKFRLDTSADVQVATEDDIPGAQATAKVGIDDRATAEALELTDGRVAWGPSMSGGNWLQRRSINDGSHEFSAGNGTNRGGNVKGYGGTHATKPNDVEIRAAGTIKARLDDSASQFEFTVPIFVPSYTVAGVPAATTAGGIIYVSNETGGAVLAFSDGTNWRRVTDRAVLGLGGPSLSGFRNKLINGDFDIWQRGTSFPGVGNEDYTADRWVALRNGSGATIGISRQAFTPGQADVPGNPVHFFRYDQTVAGTGSTYTHIRQRIEGAKTLAAKTVTCTWCMKASGALSVRPRIMQYFGTGGTPSGTTGTTAGPVNLTTSWQKFQQTLALPSVSGKTFGSNGDDTLMFGFEFPTNAVQTIDIAHVSLVEGDAAGETDPFSPRHLQQEMALCERYYEKSYSIMEFPGATTNLGRLFAYVTNLNSGAHAFNLQIGFHTEKRAIPTLTIYSTVGGASGKLYDGAGLADVTAALGGRSTSGANVSGTTSASTTISLSGQWEADAEL